MHNIFSENGTVSQLHDCPEITLHCCNTMLLELKKNDGACSLGACYLARVQNACHKGGSNYFETQYLSVQPRFKWHFLGHINHLKYYKVM